MRFCRDCGRDRSPAPPCCSHEFARHEATERDLQDRVLDFLQRSTARGGPAKRIDTHASVVFLAGRSRPVALPTHAEFDVGQLRSCIRG